MNFKVVIEFICSPEDPFFWQFPSNVADDNHASFYAILIFNYTIHITYGIVKVNYCKEPRFPSHAPQSIPTRMLTNSYNLLYDV